MLGWISALGQRRESFEVDVHGLCGDADVEVALDAESYDWRMPLLTSLTLHDGRRRRNSFRNTRVVAPRLISGARRP